MGVADRTSDTRSFDSLLSSTMEHVFKSGAVQDAIFDSTPLLMKLKESGQLQVIQGGERIRVPIMYSKNTTAKSYADDEILDTTRQDPHTTALYNWKQYSASISMTGKQKRVNKGTKEKVFDLAQSLTANATSSLADKIADGIFSDGTGNGSKDITGLLAAIETTPGSATYASIPTANTAWRNNAQATAGNTATNLLPYLRTQYNNCTKGTGAAGTAPNLGVCDQTTFETFEALLFPQVRYAYDATAKTVNAGFDALRFKGMDIFWEPKCTSGTFYLLNLNHLYLFVHADANFALSGDGMRRPFNQDALVDQVFFQGNICVDNRKKFSKVTGLT